MRTLVVALCSLVALAGCTSLPPLPPASEGPYRLDTGDHVRVLVYNDASLSADYGVGDDGMISISMIGAIKARSLTVPELQKEIYNRLSHGILVNPGVAVEISQYRPFFIVGEVAKPGTYPYIADLNVLTAVAEAGGFTVRADKQHMTVLRATDGRSAEWQAQPQTGLQPGDVVVVKERFF